MPAALLAKEGYKLVNLKGGINVRVVFIESFSQSKFPKKTGKEAPKFPKKIGNLLSIKHNSLRPSPYSPNHAETPINKGIGKIRYSPSTSPA